MEINNGVRKNSRNSRQSNSNRGDPAIENNNNAVLGSGASGSENDDRIDAIHHRFREDQEIDRQVVCLSCKREFLAKSLADIFAHFSENQHFEYFRDCLYCQGKVHQYTENGRLEYYHNCSRWRRNLDN